jgi:DNA-binding NarL/FixJ family response regulator
VLTILPDSPETRRRSGTDGRTYQSLSNIAEHAKVSQMDGRRHHRPCCAPYPARRRVVRLIAEAHTNAQIAEMLHLSAKTVESHRANVLRKLGMRDRVELVRYAIRRWLVEP